MYTSSMSNSHVRRHYLLSEETVEDQTPRHYLDTRTFKIFASMPEVVSQHGRFSFKWTRSDKQSNRWGSQSWTDIATYVSMDGTSWLPISRYFVSPGRYGDDEGHVLTRQIHVELTQIKAKYQRERTSQLAKDRRHRIKAKQEELGCTEKEAMAAISQEKYEEKCSRATKADVDRTKRIIAVAPLVRDLKNEVDALLQQLDENPSLVNITYVNRAKRDIQSVTNFLSEWNKGRRG